MLAVPSAYLVKWVFSKEFVREALETRFSKFSFPVILWA